MPSPWASIKQFFAAAFRGEDPQRQVRWITPYAVSGVTLTADQSLSLATVWACIDIIAKNIASCKWNIYEPLPGTKRRRLLDADWKTWMLNTRPNDEMTAIGFREAMLFQAIPFGNAYAEIVRDAGGRVIQLWPLLSDRMAPRRNAKTWALEYHYTQTDGTLAVFKSRSIFHLRGPGMWGLMGDNVIARAAKTLGLAAAQERFSASFFGQGAQPIGTLEYPGKLDGPTHQRLKDDWADKYKGPENAHKPLILEAGMKFVPISTDPQKAQLTEGKQFSVEEICRWFGVPPHKVQHLLHATFSNIEHSSIEFVRDSLTPWARRFEQEADAKLFDQTRGPFKVTEIDLRPLLRGDALSRAQAQASWRQNGIMSANEIRRDEGLDDCGEDGDVLLVQANLTTVQKILNDELRGLDPAADPALGENPSDPMDPSVPDDDADEVDSEDPAETADEGGVEEPTNIKRKALRSALDSALHRYGRRLENRKAAIKSDKPNRDALIAQFRNEQYKVLADELAFFNDITVSLIGRKLTTEDMAIAARMFEQGEEPYLPPVAFPPTTKSFKDYTP